MMVPEMYISCCDRKFKKQADTITYTDVVFKKIKIKDLSIFVNKPAQFQSIKDALNLDYTIINSTDPEKKQKYYESQTTAFNNYMNAYFKDSEDRFKNYREGNRTLNDYVYREKPTVISCKLKIRLVNDFGFND
jgi:hypothetical protein